MWAYSILLSLYHIPLKVSHGAHHRAGANPIAYLCMFLFGCVLLRWSFTQVYSSTTQCISIHWQTHTGTHIHIWSDLITYYNKSIIVTSQRSRVDTVDTTSINLWGPANPHFACSFGFGSDIVKSDDRYWGCLGFSESESRVQKTRETLPECVGPAFQRFWNLKLKHHSTLTLEMNSSLLMLVGVANLEGCVEEQQTSRLKNSFLYVLSRIYICIYIYI